MDHEAFSLNMYKWDHHHLRPLPPPPPPVVPAMAPAFPPYYSSRTKELEDFFQSYGVREPTVAKIAELGFTVNTLLNMRDDELDAMMTSVSQMFRWDLLFSERYGVKSAVRSQRRRQLHLLGDDHHTTTTTEVLDAFSQEGLSMERVQQEMREEAGGKKKKMKKKRNGGKDGSERESGGSGGDGDGVRRAREHPFIVTLPGEIARGKKNGLDYLFHLYEECRRFLIQVQNIAKAKGEKCPTKVTNKVYNFALEAGAIYINKPKIRHYVHCYAFHCLDEEASNALRKDFKERGQNVGTWRKACYEPLVALAGQHDWDIDRIFNDHPRLSIWYVSPKLRKLCHAQRSNVVSFAN